MTLRCLFRLVLLVEGSSYVSMVSKLLRLNASLYRANNAMSFGTIHLTVET